MVQDVNIPLLQRPQVCRVRSGPLWTLEKTNVMASLRYHLGLAIKQVKFVLTTNERGEPTTSYI